MPDPLAGEIIFADDVAVGWLAGRCVARVTRTTSSTAASAATGVLRLDDVPVVGGRRYWLGTSALTLLSTVAGDTGTARLTITTDGSTPGTGSTLVCLSNSAAIPSATNGCDVGPLSVPYYPASDLNLSVLLWTQRLSGTGNVSLSAAATRPMELYIVDAGEDPGTGFGTVL